MASTFGDTEADRQEKEEAQRLHEASKSTAIDPATVEACARVAEKRASRYSSPGGQQRVDEAHEIAKDIRALACSVPSTVTASRDRPHRWPSKGDTMSFLGHNGYENELKEALDIFQVGKSYRVHACNVQSFSHSIQFDGVKGWFNGVMFELNPVSQTPRAGDQ